MRRRPVQQRSRATVEAIEQAAALMLEGRDARLLTTNHIAERAGVSIGSLYEYFTDKDDILRSCGEKQAALLGDELSAMWRECTLRGEPLLMRQVLALPLSPFRGRPSLAKAMLLRFASTPWALAVARRQLEAFLDVIGESGISRIFGRRREEVIALTPRVTADLAAGDLGGRFRHHHGFVSPDLR